MRILCGFNNTQNRKPQALWTLQEQLQNRRGLRPETVAALNKYAPKTEFVETLGRYGYWEAIAERWTGKDDLAIIEQDIIITSDVISSFSACNQDWCSFAYDGWVSSNMDGKPTGFRRMTFALGCTKFSAQLQRRVNPVEFKASWDRVYATISSHLLSGGLQPHDHGDVEHLHDYSPMHNLVNLTRNSNNEIPC